MTKAELQQIQDLRDEVAKLRQEVDSLHEFVKALYSMMEEDGEYEQNRVITPADFGGMNN
jgi:cell division protein FtsB